MGEEKRHQMMQNLFGDQSEEEEELDSEHESNPSPNYASHKDEYLEVIARGMSTCLSLSPFSPPPLLIRMKPQGEGKGEGEGEGEVEGHGEVEIESESDMPDGDPDPGESEGERDQSFQEAEVGDQREESEERDTDSDAKDDYSQRVVTSKRRGVIESGSERSEENHYPDNDDEEVDEARISSGSSREDKDQTRNLHSAPEIRDVFGDFDDEEEDEGYAFQHNIEQDSNRSPVEEEGSYGESLRPEDILADEDPQYESEEENIEMKLKEKPLGPPLELEVPLRPPPALPEKGAK